MSHQVEYASVGVKTDNGYSILWCNGASNCTQFRNGHECYERYWSIFYSGPEMIDGSSDAIMAGIRKMTGGPYQEHWTKGAVSGKYMDDAGLIRWGQNRIKEAMPLEDILKANRQASMKCFLHIWDSDLTNFVKSKDRREVVTFVSNSAEFSQWVKEAKERAQQIYAESTDPNIRTAVYFCIWGLPVDGFRKPAKRPKDADANRYALRCGTDGWVTELKRDGDGRVCRYTSVQESAIMAGKYQPLFFSYDEAELLAKRLEDFSHRGRGKGKAVTPVSEKTILAKKEKDKQRDHVLYYKPGGWYIAKRTSHGITGTHYRESAKHFTQKEAESFMRRNYWLDGKLEMVKTSSLQESVAAAIS